MRKSTIFVIFTLWVIVCMPNRSLAAFTFEAHPGVHLAYEYTDNYHGTVSNEQSESTYEVGPSLGLSFASPVATFDLTGYAARSLHKRFSEDDSTEASITSNFSLSQEYQKVGLTYEYMQTRWRGALNEPPGVVKRNTGVGYYTWQMTQQATLSLEYGIKDDNWQAPNEDETSQYGSMHLSYLLSQKDTVNLDVKYDYYDYQISQDVKVLNTGLAWWHSVTSRLSLGLNSDYTKEDRGDLPNEGIYNLSASGKYSFTEFTSMSASGGKSWYIREHQDRESIYTMKASLQHAADRDSLTAMVSRGYSTEFTSNLYGIYETREASLTWKRKLLEALSSTAELTYLRTIPTKIVMGEDERDTVERISLGWNPIEYLYADLSYLHLQHRYEISGTARENRYRLSVEVRY